METDASLWSFNVALGVLLVDVLLSGDNAIVIALVCRRLPPSQRTRALWLGVAGALGARLVLTGAATLAMHLPLLKLLGSVLLLKIAIDLVADTGAATQEADAEPGDLWAAARTIVLADVVMSLDNVVALSAISQNSTAMLMAGLLLSMPILMFGSLYVARLLEWFPALVRVGGAILGGVAGSLLVDDPIWDGAFNAGASVANLVVPVLAAGFTLEMGRIVQRNRATLAGVPVPAQDSAAIPPAPEAAPVTGPVVTPGSTVPATPVAIASAQSAKASNAARVPDEAPKGGEHRVLMALGLFLMLVGGLVYYLVNVYQPPVPDSYLSYRCAKPPLSVRYSPRAGQVRLATPQGAVTTGVVDDRIVWDDYREAGARLGLAPPVKILSADAAQLVLQGGMFDNAACAAVAGR